MGEQTETIRILFFFLFIFATLLHGATTAVIWRNYLRGQVWNSCGVSRTAKPSIPHSIYSVRQNFLYWFLLWMWVERRICIFNVGQKKRAGFCAAHSLRSICSFVYLYREFQFRWCVVLTHAIIIYHSCRTQIFLIFATNKNLFFCISELYWRRLRAPSRLTNRAHAENGIR